MASEPFDIGAIGARVAALAPKRAFPTTFVGFCAWLGVTLTPGQRVLCSVAYDGVEPKDLSPEDKALSLTIFGAVETIPRAQHEARLPWSRVPAQVSHTQLRCVLFMARSLAT